MILCPRPSKTFLFSYIKRRLRFSNGKVGLDAASAGFKNRGMFKTNYYYGLDLNLSVLKKAVMELNDEKTYAIYADITRLEKLRNNSVDVVLSTNTLYIFDSKRRMKVIEHLSRITSPDGLLLIEFPRDENYEEALKELIDKFKNVKVIYFKNILSRAYEKIFEKDGYLGNHRIVGLNFFKFMSFILTMEYLTYKIPFINKRMLVMCADKKVEAKKEEFVLSHLPLIDNAIYNAKD